MKAIFISFALSVIFCVAFSATVPNGLVIPTSIKQSVAKLVEVQGCNANVCFGIDGSGSVSRNEFKDAKFFVKDIVDIIAVDQAAEFAAVQFSGTNSRISPLTGDKEAFLRAVRNARFEQGGATAIGAAIVYCDFQLSRRPGEANKIAVITDGRNNLGGDPVRRANNFRRRDPNGKVTAVGIGRYLDTEMLQQIAGDEKVISVDEYIHLATVVTDLVQEVCEIKPVES